MHRIVSILSLILAAFTIAGPSSIARAAERTSTSNVTSTTSINGIYAVGATNGAINRQVLANPYVDGIALHYSWATIEPQDGVFNWKLVDNQIAQAKAAGKKVSLSVMAGYQSPAWLYAAGAERFEFVWDMAWGPPLCSVQTIPVPWDSIFLGRWVAFVQALGNRYGSNPTVSHVKINGINSKTEEIFLPLSVNAPINSGQCTSFNDVADWQAVGYTLTKVEAAWEQIADTYHNSFPQKPFAAQLVPGGFPPINSNGKVIRGAIADYQVSADIISNGIADYGLQFIGQNNGLTAVWIWQELASVSTQIDTGYQMVGVMGSNLGPAVTLAVQSNAKFIEIYGTDILNPKLRSVLKSAHQSLQ